MLSRRQFLELSLVGPAAAVAACARAANTSAARAQASPRGSTGTGGGRASSRLPRPTAAQLAWQRAEFGVIFHYDLHVFDGKHYRQAVNRRTPIEDPDIFAPPDYDIDQWIETVVASGARFALLTASHETGFRLWPSDANPYCMKALRWRRGKGDLVGDFVAACRRHGIAPGLYLGARWNARLGVLDFRVQPGSKLSQAEYNALIEREVEEICSGYGPLFELWFDGGILAPELGGPDVLPTFEQHQPDCVFYHSRQRSDVRWGGSETGTVGDPCWATMPFNGSRGHIDTKLLAHGDPGGAFWSPAMADAPLRNHEWFWEPGDEAKVRSLEALLAMYDRSVGRGATLILGVTPDARGLVPEPDRTRLEELGRALAAIESRRLAGTRGAGPSLLLELEGPRPLERIVIREEIRLGQRIRGFEIEAREPGGGWRSVASGTSVGHKRIVRAEGMVADAVRLSVSDSVGTPSLAELSAYASSS